MKKFTDAQREQIAYLIANKKLNAMSTEDMEQYIYDIIFEDIVYQDEKYLQEHMKSNLSEKEISEIMTMNF